MQGIGIQRELLILQTDAIIEDSQFRTRRILPVKRRELIQGIDDQTSVEIISDIRDSLIVQAICKQGNLPILHADILPQISDLGISIVKQVISIHEQGIPLFHPDITKRLQGIGLLEEIRAITIHIRTIMAKTNITIQYLSLGVPLLIERKRIRMLQKDLRLLGSDTIFGGYHRAILRLRKYANR